VTRVALIAGLRISLPTIWAASLSAALSIALTYIFVSDNLGSEYTHSIIENGTKSEVIDLFAVLVTFLSILIPSFLILLLASMLISRLFTGSWR
jgi:hypothetical protein